MSTVSYSLLVNRLLFTIPTTLILALFIRTFLIQGYHVSSASMEETLLPGDYILVNKMIFAARSPWLANRTLLPFRSPRGGEVILFRHPHNHAITAVKRVAGVPRETIPRDSGGASSGNPPEPFQESHSILQEGSYYVLGDNRSASQDSRSWGLVQRNLILGRPFLIYWSLTPSDDQVQGEGTPQSARRIRWNRLFRWVR